MQVQVQVQVQVQGVGVGNGRWGGGGVIRTDFFLCVHVGGVVEVEESMVEVSVERGGNVQAARRVDKGRARKPRPVFVGEREGGWR